MKAVVFDRFGEPAEVLQVRELPMPAVGPGQVRVRMLASPVNPSDLLTVRGRYGRVPTLPATPGYEGVGVVDVAGAGLLAWIRGLKPGKKVAVLNRQGGNWQEYVVVPARQVVPVPEHLPDEQVASFFVNPATALVMTQHVLQVPAGSWLLQTAAASALGRMILRLGQHYHFHTINVVRRRDHAEELRRLGAQHVICTADENIADRVRALTNGRGVPFALDPVGGAMGLGAVQALAEHGRMLVYGTLSDEPIALDPRLLIAGQKTIEGFWLSEWVPEQGVLTMLRLFRRIIRLIDKGVLHTPVAATLPIDDIANAVRQAETPGRMGKVLLRIGTR